MHPLLIPVPLRRGTGKLSKRCNEMSGAAEAAVLGDLRNRKLAVLQKQGGLTDARLIDVCQGCLSHRHPEEAAEVLLVHVHELRQIRQIDFLREMIADIAQNLFEGLQARILPAGRLT